MKSAANTTLQNLLAGNAQLHAANLYTITLAGGGVTRYTDCDMNLVSGGNTFLSTDALFAYKKRKESVGLAVASCDIEVYPSSTNLIASTPWIQAAMQGLLDYARVQVERAFMATWGDTSAGTVILFNGRIADVEIGRSMLKLTIKSDIELLNVHMPRNLYQPGCLHELFDVGCTLSSGSFVVSGTVSAGTTASQVNATLAQATGYFDMGVLTMTSGALNGKKQTVKTYTNGTPSSLVLLSAFQVAPTIGDTFTLLPGCDKSQSTCTTKFSNLTHFRGMPYIPQAEAAL